MKRALLPLLSSLLLYGESLIIDIRVFTNSSRAVATLFKTDAVHGTAIIRSEEELKKIFRKANSEYTGNYIGRITFDNIEPGDYHLDINVNVEGLCGYGETFLYEGKITILPRESKNLELISVNLEKGRFQPTLMYDAIVRELSERKTILDETVNLNPGETYTKNLNVDGKEVSIVLTAPHYFRNESASILRGDRLGSNGMYLVKNDPTLELRLAVDSKKISSNPCYFDDYWEIKNWSYCYKDIFTYGGDRIDLEIYPFTLHYYPFLSIKTGMNTKGPLRNHFYFEGVTVRGTMQLYKTEKKEVKIEKSTSGRIKIIK